VDEAPMISSSQPLRWKLDPESWSEFGGVTATDPEQKGPMTFTIVDDPTDGAFEIDERTGQLFTVDRRKLEQFHGTDQTVLLSVADQSGLSAEVPFQVTVPDNYYQPPAPPLDESPDYLRQLESQMFPFGLCVIACAAWCLGLRSIRRARRRAVRSRMLEESLSPSRNRETPAASESGDSTISDASPAVAAANTEESSDTIERDIEEAFDRLEDTLPRALPDSCDEAGVVTSDGSSQPSRPKTVLSDELLARLTDTNEQPAAPISAASSGSQTSDRVNDILEAVEAALEQGPESDGGTAPKLPGESDLETGTESPSSDGGTQHSGTNSVLKTSSFAADLLNEIQNSTVLPDSGQPSQGGAQLAVESPPTTMSQPVQAEQMNVSPDAAASPVVSSSEQLAAEQTPTEQPVDDLRNSMQATVIHERVSQSETQTEADVAADADAESDAAPSDASLGQYLATLFAAKPDKKTEESKKEETPESDTDWKPTSFIESYMNSKAEGEEEMAAEPIATFHRDTLRSRNYQKMDLNELRNRTNSFREIAKQAADSAVEASLLQQARASVGKHRKILGIIGVGSVGVLIASGMRVMSFSTAGQLLVVAACLAAGEFWMCRRRLRLAQKNRPAASAEPTVQPSAPQD